MNEEKRMESFSKELKLLLLLLEVKSNTDIMVRNKEILKDIDWELFIQLSLHHRVFSVIYKRIIDINNIDIPSHVVQVLRQHYQKNIFRMLQLSGETEFIAQIFAKQEIRTLFLKGPVLAVHLYGDISLRTSADLDILIPIDQLEDAEEILLTHGYIKDDYIQTVLNDWKWRHHHITFYHPQKKIKVEIHWRLNPGPAKEPSFKHLWERKREVFLSKNPVFILGNEDLFLFLVSHGARHGWSRLRWLLDIDYFTKLVSDWKNVKRLLEEYHYLHVGGQALILASTLLNTNIQKEMKVLTESNRSERLAQEAFFYIKQMVNLHTEPVPDEIARYHKNHLFSLMSFQQKCLFIASFLFPYPEDAEVLPLPKFLHFLYFPLRPFLWAWRWGRKQTLS
ncbi:hypothetical protein J2S09_000074 [Bacillus fengqiuensis]|nr:hypothetical protein [Bacillus fengqiuensis]